MLKSRLILVLRTFTKKELRELKKWVQSPFHNQREDVIKIYDYLNESNNLFNDNLLDKAFVFPQIYPDEKFDDSKMRQVMHFLFKEVENYLLYSEQKNRDIENKIQLVKIYRKRKLSKLLDKEISKTKNLIATTNVKNELHYHNNYLLEEEHYNFLSESQRTSDLNLQNVSYALNLSFIISKLRQSCLKLAHQSVYKIDYQNVLLNEVIEYIEQNDFLNSNVISIYYYLYQILIDIKSDDNFFYLKKLIFSSFSSFTRTEMRAIFLLAINFCIKKRNSGIKEFTQEAFDLYEKGFSEKIFIENEEINSHTFRNAISIGLVLGKFDWVENFINVYGVFLEDKKKDVNIKYNQARLYFSMRNYTKAMDLVRQYEFKDILLNLSAKTMLLKMYYELSEYKALESLLESMRAYVQRKKVIGYHKEVYKNIIRYTKKLLKVNPYSKAQKEKLKAEIETAKPLTEKAWLLKQLGEL